MGNETLNAASRAKNDEFYTQLSDIANECRHYKGHFKGKTIFCNCDDPYESEFFKYFAMSFNHLELKKLIASCYTGSPIANTQLSLFDYESAENKTTKSPHRIEITEVTDENADGATDLADVELLLRNKKNALTRLQGDGDFRSAECIEMLKNCDIVVTNPPFSLFREYVAQLMEYEKKFLIIGNINAITYKEIFKYIKENQLWLGVNNGPKKYIVPDKKEYDHLATKTENGVRLTSMGNTGWFTNLDVKKRHENLILYKKYNPAEYPKYDNYDAIEVSKVGEIPVDYDGVMGVPVTFLDKYNPEQFEIVG
ncbi:MAG: adenine-specific methyltransferase EcoRI family protein, partial [Spirochaetaceae bacterium]|nr:adenine-specific methyltransferase EcoRI family protein [Spirochaetaceae bacterium]